jgi:hypothetical protein
VRWKELLFRGATTDVTIDAETAFGVTAEYSPSSECTLVGVVVIAGGIAATSLIENGHVRIDSESFGGKHHITEFQGIGLETVPRSARPKTVDMTPDLPVKTGVKLVGKYYHNVLPVTPEIVVYGIFQK